MIMETDLFQTDASGQAINKIAAASAWFDQLKPRAYRLWEGRTVVANGGKLYTEEYLSYGAVWPSGSITTNIRRIADQAMYGLIPVYDDPTIEEAATRFYEGMSCWNEDPGEIPDGDYTLLDPKDRSAWDPTDRPRLAWELSLAYLDVPTTFDGMRKWLAAHPMYGLRWVANAPDGNRIAARVTYKSLVTGRIGRTG